MNLNQYLLDNRNQNGVPILNEQQWSDINAQFDKETIVASLIDIIVKTKDGIEIIDAKYKSHFAALDADGWRRFSDDTKESLRADIHQVLAYASVFESSVKTTATIVYPVTQTLYDELKVLSQDIVAAKIPVGTRLKELRLQAMPFSGVRS